MTKSKWQICPICDGDGTYVNPNIDSHGLTAEDFHEDPDFAEDYRSGVYDVSCQTCKGTGKLKAAEVKETMERLSHAAEDRRLAALEDGDFESYQGAADYRYGY